MGFQAKKTLSSDCFGPIEHLSWPPSSNLHFGYVPQIPLIRTYEPFQLEIPVTLVTLEAKNVPLNPPQEWGFQAKKDPLKRLFWTH